ncbi:glycosyltransferase [Amycolatopsis sp. NBC_01480]|uniref:glycosyltransferase n=1 Tax=Amycolatopsis sp. NBC_01480 TaxID=2903562 RepID=UPI002E28C72E|nr:glycosyltransferase [Amycolatopsis sp. NBC_01480]
MRILFCAVPAHGHVLPMMPMARAAMSAGHEVSLLTHGALSGLVDPVPVLGVGPTFDELFATFSREAPEPRTALTTPEAIAEFFIDTRLTTTFDAALAAAAGYQPDLLIAEAADGVGPVVAAQLGVAWAQHSLGMAITAEFAAATTAAASRFHEAHGLHQSERIAYLDVCPVALQAEDWEPPADRIAVRPSPFDRETGWVPPAFEEPAKPTVLVTFGTMLDDMPLLRETLAGLADAKVNVLVTSMPDRPIPGLDESHGSVRDIGFVPLARVLPVVEAVVCAGGMGTILAVLANGLPFVGLPRFPSQRWITTRAAELGGGVVLDGPEGVAGALLSLLSADRYRRGAAAASAILSEMAEPDEALTKLLERIR